VPLENLDRAGMVERLSLSKLYVDLGDHPGRDRIPREAASQGCVVIVGRHGAARNPVDIPLAARYKLSFYLSCKPAATNRYLSDILADIDTHRTNQWSYRETIRRQAQIFATEVRHLIWFLSRRYGRLEET